MVLGPGGLAARPRNSSELGVRAETALVLQSAFRV